MSMTPVESVEDIRSRHNPRLWPDHRAHECDACTLLVIYTTLEAQRDAENTSARQWAAQCGEADDAVTALRIELAQARRELVERTEEVGRYLMANNRLAEELAQARRERDLLKTQLDADDLSLWTAYEEARREAEAATDRDNAAFADFTALVGGNTWGTVYHRIREIKAERDRLAAEAEAAKGRAKMAIEEWQTEVAALTESLKQRETELGRYMMANNALAESQSTGYRTLLRTARRLRDTVDAARRETASDPDNVWCRNATTLLNDVMRASDVQALGPTDPNHG